MDRTPGIKALTVVPSVTVIRPYPALQRGAVTGFLGHCKIVLYRQFKVYIPPFFMTVIEAVKLAQCSGLSLYRHVVSDQLGSWILCQEKLPHTKLLDG